ncbi:hypothetical protein Acr_01g0013130 [Actinidia rufa]|uniref:PA domain-containing protein n=1 Tax=Actinidia rufa TaxID=165716 RepID=A0A7J0E4T9_9ERIC|nr:hypothetical protein Acr_01g0013130 [Actinidia rufa]
MVSGVDLKKSSSVVVILHIIGYKFVSRYGLFGWVNAFTNLGLLYRLSGSIALSTRGDCDFMTKAEVGQSGGAAVLLVINDSEDLLEMSCGEKNVANITIPVVMITKSGGEAINKSMTSGKKGELQRRCFNKAGGNERGLITVIGNGKTDEKKECGMLYIVDYVGF